MKRSKKVIFTAIMLFMVIICIEGLARLTYLIMFDHNYNVNNLYNIVKSNNYGLTDEFALWWDQEIIHPYLGFVVDYQDEKKNKETYGFSTTVTPLIKREPGKLNVVILGGSVAQSMGKALETAFHRACRVPPNVVILGLAGYKQPQQLLALTYFLSLGAQYDLVINIDGYNEIVLPFTDNYRVGVNPFFPRNWNLRINRLPTHKVLAQIGKLRYLRDRKQENLEALPSSLFRWSAIFGLVKMQQFKKMNWEINRGSHKLFNLQQEEVKKFEETGPFWEYEDIQQLYQEAAAVWVRGSVLLDQLARENGMEYYHFLQPNQYVKGSKVLNREEMRIAYLDDVLISKSALIGYPILLQQGRKLLEKNIKFFDATKVFAKEKETIYIDICCHFNERGKDILAAYIMDQIAQNPKMKQFLK